MVNQLLGYLNQYLPGLVIAIVVTIAFAAFETHLRIQQVIKRGVGSGALVSLATFIMTPNTLETHIYQSILVGTAVFSESLIAMAVWLNAKAKANPGQAAAALFNFIKKRRP